MAPGGPNIPAFIIPPSVKVSLYRFCKHNFLHIDNICNDISWLVSYPPEECK